MKRFNILPFYNLLFVMLVWLPTTFGQTQKKVLLISSYNSSFPTFFQQIEGIKSVFDTAEITLDVEFMDSKRFVDEENMKLFAQLLSFKLSQTTKYDAVITTDDNALNFALSYQDSMFKEMPIVFAGVNNRQNALDQNKNKWVTGVVEAVSMKETIRLMLSLFDKTNAIYAIVDGTASGQGDLVTYYNLQDSFPAIEFKEIPMHELSMSEYKEKLNSIPQNVPVLLLSAYFDKSKKTISFKESISIINEKLQAPLFHLWQHGLGDGVLGGKIISHYMQGQKAAAIVYSVLSGTGIDNYAVEAESPNVYMFDYVQLKKFHISNTQLPEEFEILNEPQNFYEKYKTIIHTVAVVFIFLLVFILVLMVYIVKLRKARARIKKQNLQLDEERNKAKINEIRFRNLFEHNPVSLWEEDFSEVFYLLEKAKEQTADIEEYIDLNPDFVNKCAASVKVIKVNNATQELLGFNSLDDLINNISKTFNEASLNTFKDLLKSIANNNKEFICETEYVTSANKTISCILQVIAFEDDNKGIVTITDTTKIKEIQNELAVKYMELQSSEEELAASNEELHATSDALRDNNAELMKAKQKAEESDRLKTEFINNMSHEIRTPMNGILGFTELLSGSDLSESKRNQYIDVVRGSTYQLLRVIEDIMEISKLSTKQVRLIETDTNINEILNELYSVFSMEKETSNLKFLLENSLPDNDFSISIDKSKLKIILSNLIENAFKYTNEGSIVMGCMIIENEIVFYVKDTGIGIEEEKQELIFKRFAQADGDVSRMAGGLGLGLAIAKGNTELLGGRIELLSEYGVGSEFRLYLPFKKKVQPDLVQVKEEKPALKTDRKYKILVAEDEIFNFRLINILLEEAFNYNIEILHANNGKEAVDKCREHNDINLVLMDIKMPEMNGLEATRAIKQIRTNLPVIAQTAYASEDDEKEALQSGCDHYLTKPIKKDMLVEVLVKFLTTSEN